MKIRLSAILVTALALSSTARADLSFKDDTGQEVRLKAPARRIVALAPHIAESLFAAGAGDKLVGTVDYSDYPPEAKKVPRVGGYSRVDLEAVAALKPDLVLAWESGNNMPQISKLKALGLTVYVSQPNKMENVADQLERLGQLAGSEAVARPAAERFRQRLEALRKANAGKPKVRTFYQIWKTPLMTVGGPQIISDAITLCGGENVFGHLGKAANGGGKDIVGHVVVDGRDLADQDRAALGPEFVPVAGAQGHGFAGAKPDHPTRRHLTRDAVAIHADPGVAVHPPLPV